MDPSDAPSIPRPITAIARRRAWSEPRVRFWLLAAVVLLGVGLWFIASGIRLHLHERWLINHGVKVCATIISADGEPVKGKHQPPTSFVVLRFRWHDADFESPARTLPGRKQFIVVGSTLAIRVNPEDPSDWTWLDEPLPLLMHLIGAVLTLPLAGLVFVWAMLRQRKILRLWRRGTRVETVIVETRFTAAAPSSRAARVTPVDDDDARVYTVYLPPRAAALKVEDPLPILLDPRGSRWAVALVWFE